MSIQQPYLLFLGDAADQLAAKTAAGVAHWRPEWCAGQLRLDDCHADLGLPDLTLEAAADRGVRTIIVGVANRGGVISEAWIDTLERGIALGMNVASGLHNRLIDVPRLAEAAATHNRSLSDVRQPPPGLPVGTGVRRPGKRLLTVGTDVSCGKMFAALALEREMRGRGLKADFRATGQTGILIAGEGIAVDAVVADFISGAAEVLSPANEADHWDLIEGQGSLYHLSYAGVSLGLLHGSQPDALVMCHEPTRPHLRGLPGRTLPDLKECIATNVALARMTNPACVCVGVAVNTQHMDRAAADGLTKQIEDELDVPCVDALLDGVGRIVDRLPKGGLTAV
ncbi:MAG: N-acetyltransferase DgcN [Kiloniellales bacterium]